MKPVKKRERRSISLEVKSDILKLYAKGVTVSLIAQKLKLPRSTVQAIVKEKSKITSAIESYVSMKATIIRNHQGLISEMEKLLSEWMNEQIEQGVPLNNFNVIQKKALSLLQTLRENKGDNNQECNFAASRGWFMRFKKRYSFDNISVRKESTNVNEELAQNFPESLWKIVQEGGLSERLVFDVVETGLFWKKKPSRIRTSQQDEGAAKDRLTLLLGSNARGDFKLKPLLIYKSAEPIELKNYDKETLPVIWKSNSKARVTEKIFEEWFTQYFIPEVKDYCLRNNLPYKALLLVDNCPCHPYRIISIDPQIKVLFLPSSKTPFFLPMDQGIVASFKAFYLKEILSQAAEINKLKGTDLDTFWKNYNILDAIKNIALAWKDIKSSSIRRVWEKAVPQLILKVDQDESDFDTYDEGLLDSKFIKIEEQRVEDEQEEEESVPTFSNEEKRLSSEKIIEAINHLHTAMDIFDKNDPNSERSFKVNNDIVSAYECYMELYINMQSDSRNEVSIKTEI